MPLDTQISVLVYYCIYLNTEELVTVGESNCQVCQKNKKKLQKSTIFFRLKKKQINTRSIHFGNTGKNRMY